MLLEHQAIRLLRLALIVAALVGAVVFGLRSLGTRPASAHANQQRVESAELDRKAAAARAAIVVKRAAATQASSKPALARAESLHSRVVVERRGELRVRETGAAEAVLVPVPPPVTDRIQADSVAISALAVALTWNARAVAAQEEQLVAEATARDAARLTITQLERQRNPRCGWRCGMLLGAASIVALGIAVDEGRRLLHN